MLTAICIVPISPMRPEPSHKTEQLNQQLFGEFCTILETEKDWYKIQSNYDGYIGWVTANHLTIVDEHLIQMTTQHFTCEWTNLINFNKQDMQIPFGCMLPGLLQNHVQWNEVHVEYHGELQKRSAKNIHHQLEAFAFMFMNTPYLWGGKSVFGIDCSGFAQQVFKLVDIHLPRDAKDQAQKGESVGFLAESKIGDLAFFDNEEGEIIHVGILLNERQIIHAAGKVRIDHIDSQGIINSETNLRTHQLRIIKRYY